MTSEVEPHDAHVRQARKLFRDCGLDLMAMQFPRCPEALAALRAYNRVPDNWPHPYAWNFHPNAWCRDNWRSYLPSASS